MNARGLRVNFGTRRDMCYFVGRRASRLNPCAASHAWSIIAQRLQDYGDPASRHYKHLPKFLDLLALIRGATINGYQTGKTLRMKGWVTEPKP